jgi:hypothetical protein
MSEERLSWGTQRENRLEETQALQSDIGNDLADVAAGRVGKLDVAVIAERSKKRLAARGGSSVE